MDPTSVTHVHSITSKICVLVTCLTADCCTQVQNALYKANDFCFKYGVYTQRLHATADDGHYLPFYMAVSRAKEQEAVNSLEKKVDDMKRGNGALDQAVIELAAIRGFVLQHRKTMLALSWNRA
eukprot:5605725-Ditylum_brightwellii.AAC.1